MALGQPLDYSLKRWAGLSRYATDGGPRPAPRLPIDNNPVALGRPLENIIRPIAMGKNYPRSVIMRSAARPAAWGAAERTMNFA